MNLDIFASCFATSVPKGYLGEMLADRLVLKRFGLDEATQAKQVQETTDKEEI